MRLIVFATTCEPNTNRHQLSPTSAAALDFEAVYGVMSKPAFIFDGRNILPHAQLRRIGFEVYAIGKPEQFSK